MFDANSGRQPILSPAQTRASLINGIPTFKRGGFCRLSVCYPCLRSGFCAILIAIEHQDIARKVKLAENVDQRECLSADFNWVNQLFKVQFQPRTLRTRFITIKIKWAQPSRESFALKTNAFYFYGIYQNVVF